MKKQLLYIACKLIEWDSDKRDKNDPEAISIIEWLEPSQLIDLMKKQGKRFNNRVDADESEMINRVLPYIKKALQ